MIRKSNLRILKTKAEECIRTPTKNLKHKIMDEAEITKEVGELLGFKLSECQPQIVEAVTNLGENFFQ